MPLSTLALFTLGATVSLSLAPGLTCPAASVLAERLSRVGLAVVSDAAELEVSVAQTPTGLLLTARRPADGKTFERLLPPGDDCNTLERLVTVLIHSWTRLHLPPLAPRGSARTRTDGGLTR